MKIAICILIFLANIASQAARVIYPVHESTEIPTSLTLRGAWNPGQSNGHIRLYEYLEDGSLKLVAQRREARTPEMRIPSENSGGKTLKQNTRYRLEFQDAQGHQHTAASEFWAVTSAPIISVEVDLFEDIYVGDTLYCEAFKEAKSGALTSWQWSVNGIPVAGATEDVFEHTVTSAGSLIISCTATGPGGKQGSKSVTLIVSGNPPPQISVDVETPEPVFVADTIAVSAWPEDDSGDIKRYEWYVNGNLEKTEEEGYFEVTPRAAGLFTIMCVAVGFDEQRGSAAVDFAVQPLNDETPRFTLEMESAGDVLEGDVVTIVATPALNSPRIVRYEWTVNKMVQAGEFGSSLELVAEQRETDVECRAIGEKASASQSMTVLADEWPDDGECECEFCEEEGCDEETCECTECNCGNIDEDETLSWAFGTSAARLGLPLREDDEVTIVPVFGPEGRNFRVEVSSDLDTWTEVEIVTIQGGKAEAFDVTEGAGARFYRACELIFAE